MFLLKRIRVSLILGSIEIFIYFLFRPQVEKLENFFFVWMIIFIALLFFDISDMSSDSNSSGALSILMSGSSSGASYGRMAGVTAEHMYKTDKEKNEYEKGVSGLFEPKNLAYLILILVNLIGFWIF